MQFEVLEVREVRVRDSASARGAATYGGWDDRAALSDSNRDRGCFPSLPGNPYALRTTFGVDFFGHHGRNPGELAVRR
ncbi:hypothetical protein ACWGLP_19690 [Streptomyces lydicus]